MEISGSFSKTILNLAFIERIVKAQRAEQYEISYLKHLGHHYHQLREIKQLWLHVLL
jgi:molybdopterin-guanine dinucleotide biosynthesis protein